MKKIVIAGGTGFLGQSLRAFFEQKGYQVVILSRTPLSDQANVKYHEWDGKHLWNWTGTLEDAEALINLTGKSVDCRYNAANKKLIYDSRLDATKVLGLAIGKCVKPPKVWINAASATIYRHAVDKQMDEITGELGTGFSVDVCRKWEETFQEQLVPETRKVVLRIAIVLGKNGGALQPLKKLVQFGLGGKQGPGTQFFSWIHEADFVQIVDRVIQDPSLCGHYNVAAPQPVTNADLMKSLRNTLHIPIGIPMPGWLLKLGALMINTETELILKSRNVIPAKLSEAGYKFKFATLKDALNDLLCAKQ